ncbi:hypothetical protein GCM10010219_21160 [Streptomyces netropsis]|nr:hypothetical protein GCM10010219_21160 [Streptomyces netropsis]
MGRGDVCAVSVAIYVVLPLGALTWPRTAFGPRGSKDAICLPAGGWTTAGVAGGRRECAAGVARRARWGGVRGVSLRLGGVLNRRTGLKVRPGGLEGAAGVLERRADWKVRAG